MKKFVPLLVSSLVAFVGVSPAATTYYTQSTDFLAALNAPSAFSIRPTETYEAYSTNAQILEGGSLGLYSYSGFPVYDEGSLSGRIDDLSLTDPHTGFFSVAGGTKSLGSYFTQTSPVLTAADYFFAGDSFTVTLPGGTRAIGLFFNSRATVSNDDLYISTLEGTAENGLANYDTVQASNDASGTKNLFFVGLISDTPFTTAQIGQALGGGSGWAVDNLITARSSRINQMTAAATNLWSVSANWSFAAPDSTTNGDTAELVGATNTVTTLDTGVVKIGNLQTGSAATGGSWTITSPTNSLKMDNGVNNSVIQNLRTGASDFIVDVDLSLNSDLVVTGVSGANSNVTLGATVGGHSITGAKNLTLAGVAGGGVLTVNDDVNITGAVTNLSASGTQTIAGSITGAGTVVTQNGASTLVLSGTNAYTGGTVIAAGILNINADTALGAASGGVAISNGAVLQAAGPVTSNRAITLGAGGGQIDTNGSTVTLGAGSSVTGTTLTKAGPGTLNLDGAQGYQSLVTTAGVTNVNSALGDGTATVSAGAATNFTTSQTLASLNIGAGGVVTLGSAPPPFAAPAKSVAAEIVPEPGALACLGLGALALCGRRRRK